MHPSRRRKKRPNYGIRTVEVARGPNGFGFTISGQQPCILSCIVANSPADQAGLRAGDFLISVNGVSVSKITHDAVVGLIGNCLGPIKMTIAENYYSDSSDEELECNRMVSSRKPKYMHKNRQQRTYKTKNDVSMDDEAGPIEYKAFVGYVGTIEMPKQLLPNSRLQTVCSCIRRLRQEKRTPTAVLMTVLPTCLTLKNASNNILAIYPTNRVVYIGSTADKDSRYFGLVTSAISDAKHDENNVSNSCHVFVTDPKLADHSMHVSKADTFRIACTPDPIAGNCLEFPRNALYIVSLVQNMYKLQNETKIASPMMANSPQPSASSNSDSGIGFRDDCGNISDRILVVEFPLHRPPRVSNGTSNRAQCVETPLNNTRSATNGNIGNIRACENIKNRLDKPEGFLAKQINENTSEYNRLTCRALPERSVCCERAVDVPDVNCLEFRVPLECKKSKKNPLKLKMVGSCDDLGNAVDSYKLSPKVYGMVKPNFSCEQLNNLDAAEKLGYGSLQDLSSLLNSAGGKRSIAQSEPDVRIRSGKFGDETCDQNGKNNNGDGPAAWATSFEKLLEDPLGLHAFAEFLKKEFSAENIYFWTACERYRKLHEGPERIDEAQRIYQQHLSVGAPEAVNVDSHGRQCTEQALKNPGGAIFEQAQKQIFNLMKFDSYPRFLKSDIYKQCLSGTITKPQMDTGLLLNTPVSTPSKLKKSLSNAEDRRRKSLLPWHRKNRSKSKDRGENEYVHRQCDVRGGDNMGKTRGSDVHSSRSSLTSLDLAVTNQDVTKPMTDTTGARTALCRVLLSNGSTTVVQIKEGETIQQLVVRLLDKRGISYSSFEVLTNKHPKPLDVVEASSKLAGCEVTVEQRVVFKLDLPNRKIISVKSKYTKMIVEVLRPILHKYEFSLEDVLVTDQGKQIDVHLPVTSIDGTRLNVQLKRDAKENDAMSISPVKGKQNNLDEITNKVFEGILQGKSDTPSFKHSKSDKGSIKSEDWGSEHSSGIFGKFLRRDSAVHERRKKTATNRHKIDTEVENNVKRPLIAKWMNGASKFHVSNCSESDELVEGITRAQRRLEDQRGTEINFELPDFLKDKENGSMPLKPPRKTASETRFYLTESSVEKQSPNYENQKVLVENTKSDDESRLVETTVIENPCYAVPRGGEPPPLPPKPKIVPIKPPNWGQNGFYKNKNDERSQMFLEQPSSSFV